MHLTAITTSDGRTRYVVLDDNGELVVPIVRYLKHLDLRGFARNTLRTYGTHLTLFFTFLQQQSLDFRHLTIDELAAFVHWLKRPTPSAPTGRANRTINHILTAVTSLYDYFWRCDELPLDFADKTRIYLSPRARSYKSLLYHLVKDQPVETQLFMQPVPKRRPLTLTKAQVECLLAHCHHQRDRLLLHLLYESSMRIGEALALWLEDIDVARYQIHVRDRGELVNLAEMKSPAAERVVDVSPQLIAQILNYVAVAHTDTVSTNHLFIKLRGPQAGQPITYPDVSRLFQRLRRQTGIVASAHVLRHSSLTALAQHGWQPEHLRERAGHVQFQTTYQLYVHPTDEELRDAWEQTVDQLRLQAAQEPHDDNSL
jgi:integrase/recombinase XerD